LPEGHAVKWDRKDILGLEELTAQEIEFILETAESFREVSLRPIRKVPALRGKTIITLFFEPSTRTRMSFELAAKRLSADTVNISSSVSSVAKGETLRDTVRNIEAMKVDIIIMRHSMAGAPHLLAREVSPGVINAGDGAHEHPTQGLIDIFTMREKKGKIKGLKVVIIGDIAHSRVARSNIWGLRKLGALVSVVAPPTLIPAEIERMGVRVCYSIKEAIRNVDVINVLRIQRERQEASLFPSIREYHQLFGITRKSLESAPFDALIMHPGPINRGVELDDDVADGPYSVILDQVTNGLAVRMAVLYLISGASEKRNRGNEK
jgi:aspartate carbamoyltransferase catalytic subunit